MQYYANLRSCNTEELQMQYYANLRSIRVLQNIKLLPKVTACELRRQHAFKPQRVGKRNTQYLAPQHVAS